MLKLFLDIGPLRTSRDLRLLLAGNVVSTIGAQAALVALPLQVYVLTGSPLLTGLLGAVELVPIVGAALLAGALSDRQDRRSLLVGDQVGLALVASALAALALVGSPPLAALYALAAALAGLTVVNGVLRAAIVPNLVSSGELKSALALTFATGALANVIGPALGGVVIAVFGISAAYLLDAVTCAVMIAALLPMAPQRVRDPGPPTRLRRSILEGLRHVRGQPTLVGTLSVDFMAMTFGMPRILFPALALGVYDAGPEGAGALAASVAAGATAAALLTGWLARSRRLGRVVIGAIALWGASVAAAGLAGTIVLACVLFAVAGAADSVSTVCRHTINQSITPDAVRGRMTSIYSLVSTSGPRLGDVESGLVASATGLRFSVVSGGLACLLGVVMVMAATPSLLRYDADDWL